MRLATRPQCLETFQRAKDAGLSDIQARIVAGRLKSAPDDVTSILHPTLSHLPHPEKLKDAGKAANRLAKAIIGRQIIGIVTDYDVDGITSHAIIVKACTEVFQISDKLLQSFIGHRLRDGYGLGDGLVERILCSDPRPDVIITADCGSSDQARISILHQAGIDVIVTDHHLLPEEGPPRDAFAVVNPSQSDCAYPDDSIAGCLTAWLLMSLLRQQLVSENHLPDTIPKLGYLLDFVALGTVADCVSIASPINRAMVNCGLQLLNRMNRPCWQALQQLLNRNTPFDSDDLAFQIGPRINARSRMADPYAALHFLLAEQLSEAHQWLAHLDSDNQQRKTIESKMTDQARSIAEQQIHHDCRGLVIYLPEGHPGVQGIVASRLVERYGHPTIVLCPSEIPGQLSGSGRGIETLHLRDALEDCRKLLIKFGGHKAAAGLTLNKNHLDEFQRSFNQAVRRQLGATPLTPCLWTDGELDNTLSLDIVRELEQLIPFGREFEPPLFQGRFEIQGVRTVGADPIHLSMELLSPSGHGYRAIWFRALENSQSRPPVTDGDAILAAYRPTVNHFRGNVSLNLQIIHAELIPPCPSI